jgi:formylglycine-generating enzyme required for sulfatase activity
VRWQHIVLGLVGLLALLFVPSCARTSRNPETPAAQTVPRQELAKKTVPQQELPKTKAVDLGGGVKLEMVLIPAGKFMMGSPKDEVGRQNDEVQHEVIFSQPFYLGKYEVTQEEYEAVTGKNPSAFSAKRLGKGAVAGQDTRRLPVENVSWDDTWPFYKKLNEQQPQPGWQFGLPTEAQWEYACRAGTTTPFHFGKELNGRVANCNGSEPYGTNVEGPNLAHTCRVGSYEANAWGLYDMHGNVSEWCQDWYTPYLNTGWRLVSDRVIRGGGWNADSGRCRAADRSFGAPTSNRNRHLGFRLALVPSDSK